MSDIGALTYKKENVDVTADWCLTCKTNKIRAINVDNVKAELAKSDVVALQADWTTYDPSITTYLASLGRRAVESLSTIAPLGGAHSTRLLDPGTNQNGANDGGGRGRHAYGSR